MLPNAIFKNGPIFLFIFVLFSLQFQYKLKKHRWCAWDSNPGPQDGRRRRNHGAMVATPNPNAILALNKWSKINKNFANVAKFRQIWSHWYVDRLTIPVLLLITYTFVNHGRVSFI